MKTLIINTYAGSLLLGAQAVPDSQIIGSFEDCGFGSKITKANHARFTETDPSFQFIDHIKQWPQDLDLTDALVLAHPPCAAFSQQNTSAAKRGVNTDAFGCTRKVLKYAMNANAAGIAVESVMGALGGAWDVHDHMAEVGGYHVYRILKNSILFGVPQFRERFWCVFIRKDAAPTDMTWRLRPILRTISGTLDHLYPGTRYVELDKTITKFVTKLQTEQGLNPDDVRRVGLAEIDGYKRRGFSTLVGKEFFPTIDPKVVCRKYVSPFTSAQPSVLAPGGFAPVLLGSSLWVYRGAPVIEEGYKAIMGFPADYVFPEDRGHGMRTYLSKGVCPPVATWVLDNLRMHFGLQGGTPLTRDGGYVKVVQPGRIASFRPTKQSVLKHLESMWKLGCSEDDEAVDLRNEEEDLES